MREMIKLDDGTWTYSTSTSPKVDLNVDLPVNITIDNELITQGSVGGLVGEKKIRRNAGERKAKP